MLSENEDFIYFEVMFTIYYSAFIPNLIFKIYYLYMKY